MLVHIITGLQAVRHKHVGMHAHGLVIWGDMLLILDSGHGALVAVHSATGQRQKMWQVKTYFPLEFAMDNALTLQVNRLRLFVQARGDGKFLKGLAVVGNVAYFGISPLAERSKRSDPRLNCELAAFHLLEKRLLWIRKVAPFPVTHSSHTVMASFQACRIRRIGCCNVCMAGPGLQVPTHGLLNTIAVPHLSEASTYRAVTIGNSEAGATPPLGESTCMIMLPLSLSWLPHVAV